MTGKPPELFTLQCCNRWHGDTYASTSDWSPQAVVIVEKGQEAVRSFVSADRKHQILPSLKIRPGHFRLDSRQILSNHAFPQ